MRNPLNIFNRFLTIHYKDLLFKFVNLKKYINFQSRLWVIYIWILAIVMLPVEDGMYTQLLNQSIERWFKILNLTEYFTQLLGNDSVE